MPAQVASADLIWVCAALLLVRRYKRTSPHTHDQHEVTNDDSFHVRSRSMDQDKLREEIFSLRLGQRSRINFKDDESIENRSMNAINKSANLTIMIRDVIASLRFLRRAR